MALIGVWDLAGLSQQFRLVLLAPTARVSRGTPPEGCEQPAHCGAS